MVSGNYYRNFWGIIIMAMCVSSEISAAIKMPAVFSDNMVLQRDTPITVWGAAAVGEKITVKFAGQNKKTVTDGSGKWALILNAMPPSTTSREMLIYGQQNTVKIKNILVGDVWMASGQSNMEMRVKDVKNAKQEIKKADFPEIRMFIVKKNISSSPQNDCDGEWLVCSPQSVASFSAVAYFFARELYTKYQIPSGIINASVGSSSCQAWTPREVLYADKSLPQPSTIASENYLDLNKYSTFCKKIYSECEYKDSGIKDKYLAWAKLETNTVDWKECKVSGSFESQGMRIDGAVWFRKEIEIPQDWIGADLQLSLGPIRNNDTVFINGEKIGATDSGNRTWVFRFYTVPAKFVKPGRNVICVRIFNAIGKGGFYPKYPKPLKIYKDQKNKIILTGTWKCKIEQAYEPSKLPFALPPFYGMPTGLFNAMISPFVKYPIRGFIWYQGESNTASWKQYSKLFPAMIKSWRKLWGNDKLPFYFVQLANYKQKQKQPSSNGWAYLRESQQKALALNNTGMAVSIDLGEADNIHPLNKQDVGKRLARWAMRDCYNDKNIEVSGPLYVSNYIEENKIRIKFAHTNGNLKVRGTALKGFSIAGADKKFIWAKARIDGNNVLVWSNKIKKPCFVRYAWAINPECNLYNGAGLPASPFRTDN